MYNRASIVERTLKSIVEQTYRPLHVILVDNNSTDNTREVLEGFKRDNEKEDFRVTVLCENKAGACAARNSGLRVADSEWVMFFDSDDVMDAPLVESYMQKIKDVSGDVDIVVTRIDTVFLNGTKRNLLYFESDMLKNHIFDACLSTQRYIVRREFIENAGGWNENLLVWNDWELGVRLLLKHPRMVFMGETTMVHTFQTKISITGTNRANRCGDWEKSLDAIDALIRNSDEPTKDTLLKYVEFRRIALAGNYAFEGHRKEAKQLYDATYARVRTDKTMSWLYPLLYKYIGIGGFGAYRIVKSLIK